jgi:hypothetical protein
MTDVSAAKKNTFPVWGWIGFALIVIFWPVNWFLTGARSIWAFFPLWTGYALAVDGIVLYRTGTSQIHRNKKGFVSLFIISAPSWWLFEVLNHRVQNWYYLGVDKFTFFEYFILSTINFSTVMPAIFESAELLSSIRLFDHVNFKLRIPKTKITVIGFFAVGTVMLGLLLIWPLYFFPFMWMSIYFILEPINIWLGNASLADFTDRRNWKPVLYLFTGALLTGFFWEFWNYFSYPKWVYTIPFVGIVKIFEMPLLGYFGYLPFALELCVIFQIFNGFLKIKNAGLFPVFEQTCKD